MRKSIWSVKVDYLMEFTNQAIDDPGELAKLPGASGPERSQSLSALKVIKTTERAENATPGTNGTASGTPP